MDNQSKHILLSYLFEDAASAKKLKRLSDKISSVHQEHKAEFEKSAKKKLKDSGFSEVKTGKDSCIYQKIDGDTVHTVKLDKYSPSMNYSNSNGRTSSYYHHIEHEDSHIDKGLAQMVYGGSMYESEDINEISKQTLRSYIIKGSQDVLGKSYGAGYTHRVDGDDKKANKQLSKAAKRLTGINTASAKLAPETAFIKVPAGRK